MLPDLLSIVVPFYAAYCQLDLSFAFLCSVKGAGLDSLGVCLAETLERCLLCLALWPLMQTLCLHLQVVSPMLVNRWTLPFVVLSLHVCFIDAVDSSPIQSKNTFTEGS